MLSDLNSQQCDVALRKQLPASLNYIHIPAAVFMVVVIKSISVFCQPAHIQYVTFIFSMSPIQISRSKD